MFDALGDEFEGGEGVIVLADPRLRQGVRGDGPGIVIAAVEGRTLRVVCAGKTVERVGAPPLIDHSKEGPKTPKPRTFC